MKLRPLSTLFLLFTAARLTYAQVPEIAPSRTELTADDLVMTSTATETRAICTGHVVLVSTNMRIACDCLEIVAARTDDPTATIGEFEGFKYLLATGNVRLVQGNREATCGRAEVLPDQERVVLKGDPVVIDHSTDFIAAGSEITLFRGQRRLEVKNLKATGPLVKDLGPDAPVPAPTPTPETAPAAKD
ncbi:MAG: hypothetical protein J6386_20120 [Candidatus Synoicihabitans palmerolidicus]|nr:hypothetical protein [Candidatus Synoicihabitans palmerolidicus]